MRKGEEGGKEAKKRSKVRQNFGDKKLAWPFSKGSLDLHVNENGF